MILTRPNGDARKVESRTQNQGPILWGREGRPFIMGKGGEVGDDADSPVVAHASFRLSTVRSQVRTFPHPPTRPSRGEEINQSSANQ